MKTLARWLFESSTLTPIWAAWSVGYVVIGADGRIYLTAAGEEYLSGVDNAANREVETFAANVGAA